MSLPAPSTLSNWIKDFKLGTGFLWNSLDVMRKNFSLNKCMTNFDLTVLSFDVVKIAETIEYIHSLDQAIGPFKQIQDSLGNLFPRLRQISGFNVHPSPVDALNRIRLLMLGKQAEFSIPNAPVKCRSKNEEI
ncbi:unnamed protein product [Lepeophtheirus salmonis]|uniref:(salmon louse) hypothetical protein n=1 Tax=Lepeophtheirus salmonis TaxID=72036 RepID=A0A7R8CMD6_LEPSM|nr:unnamed protein product [Lepeophtheirus salmonis]CAF2831045.1 unnamed protein product [Lepeophtheirus salmonis]